MKTSGPLSYLRSGDVGTRTPDPHTASVMLSQLSYIPITKRISRKRNYNLFHEQRQAVIILPCVSE
jgi:hypothetical protein